MGQIWEHQKCRSKRPITSPRRSSGTYADLRKRQRSKQQSPIDPQQKITLILQMSYMQYQVQF